MASWPETCRLDTHQASSCTRTAVHNKHTLLLDLNSDTHYIPLQSRLNNTTTHKDIMIRSKRFVFLALSVFAVLSFLFLGPYKAHLPSAPSLVHDGQQQSRSNGDSQALLTGHAIAPKLGNETAKYVKIDGCGHKSLEANTARIEQNSAAQPGNFCTPTSPDSPRSPPTKRKKRCDSTSTCSSASTHAESARSTLARS